MSLSRRLLSAALIASLPAMLMYLAVNAAVEYAWQAIAGISFTKSFEHLLNREYGSAFHAANLLLFFAEIYLVMFLYGTLRAGFSRRFPAVAITIGLGLGFAALFLGQMVNLGLYPLRPALVFLTASAAAFPVSVSTGAVLYDHVYQTRKATCA
jgi:hypothetical protein